MEVSLGLQANLFFFFFHVSVKEDFSPPGNFGGGVQSFFVLLRFLVLLNFFSFLLIAGFVLIPSIVFGSEGTDLTNLTGNIAASKPMSVPLDQGIEGGGHQGTVGLLLSPPCPHATLPATFRVSRQRAVSNGGGLQDDSQR